MPGSSIPGYPLISRYVRGPMGQHLEFGTLSDSLNNLFEKRRRQCNSRSLRAFRIDAATTCVCQSPDLNEEAVKDPLDPLTVQYDTSRPLCSGPLLKLESHKDFVNHLPLLFYVIQSFLFNH